MAIAATVYDYLRYHQVAYSLLPHSQTDSASESARAAVVPANDCAKAVMVRQGEEHLMAVIPANRYLDLHRLNKMMRGHYHLEAEADFARLFDDCSQGAIPAIGQAYAIPVVWDDALAQDEDVYLEAGDHRDLIHLSRQQFIKLMSEMPHGTITKQFTGYPPVAVMSDGEFGL
ncbi:MAG: YbaK/EbsC family protein [Hahellaceae bacterium]|nr:YbaK/EbsC family protein [Hahellaceae bacterium]MCP5169149.1 YbaK/EbsC family protein [Hahellaceae bacterium]